MIPLRIQVLFHWESQEARWLAGRLYHTFSARPTGGGPRIPIRYGPKSDSGPAVLELTAEHEILVVLMDERMARRARASDRPVADKWGRLISDLVRDHGPGSTSPHHVLPVALDSAALQLMPDLDEISFVRVDVREGSAKERHITLHVAGRALRALQNIPPPSDQEIDQLPQMPVRLFISHAKADLPRDRALAQGPVKAMLATVAELPVEGWVDAKQIPPGGRFDEEIKNGVLYSTALIAVLTDNWSTSAWCRREVQEAKEAGRPIVLVDALQAGVARLFPYLGNALTLRWRAAIAAPDPELALLGSLLQRWEAEDAALVIQVTLLEALRYLQDHQRLLGSVGKNEVALGTRPEAATLIHLPPGTKRIWYPDPPLGRKELERLQPAAGADPTRRVDLTTPLSQLACWQRPPGVQTVAVSLSNAPDSKAYGGSPEHVTTFAEDIVLYLLLARLRVAYGGVLGHDALHHGAVEGDDINYFVEGDDINYVERLLAMVRSYSPFIIEVIGEPAKPIANWVAWPIHRKFGDAEFRVYGQEAVLEDLGPPPDLEVGDDVLQPLASGYFHPDTPPRRYAWARSLTFMRQTMQQATSARILMGGKLTGYTGLWPGVLEEGVIALRARQPLYPLGIFGGAARLMVDTLQGNAREELASSWFAAKVAGWEELKAEYAQYGRAVQTPEELGAELRQAGAVGLAAALNNGLSDAENHELTTSDDPQRAVALILEGIRRKLGS